MELYKHFDKNFEEECKLHLDVARDTEHIVSIDDYFDSEVRFGDRKIQCHVAVMEFIDGESLEEYLQKPDPIPAASAAQLAIDLFKIWRELSNKLVYHNDLHANNIIVQRLGEDARRAEAIEGVIRAKAIDLGSVADKSKSDCGETHIGDQHWLAQHVQRLVLHMRRTRRDIDAFGDLDNRLADSLEKISDLLSPSANAARIPTPDELIRLVKDEFFRVRSPWYERPRLERFHDSFNAATLEPWFVPFLLVDPDGQWIRRIGTSGPMVVIGMRGCGKTMLLRALEFHARATRSNGVGEQAALARVAEDEFVGLFVSCTRLLKTPGSTRVQAPFERLFCAYCIQAIRAVRHFQELHKGSVNPLYHEALAEAVQLSVSVPRDFERIRSDHDLERALLSLRAALSDGDDSLRLKSSPADAFTVLAEAIRKCSPAWNSSRVFFLLDDVSTRFLQEPMIGELFSSLLFQSPVCAFKLSTEAQTLEMALHSPGLIERARAGRDYEVFDLGAEVYEKTRERRGRDSRLFIEEVLERRAQHYPNHPKLSPGVILGDCNLEEIARRIATTAASSRVRKSVYHGISALSAVCVGDIGDVIRLYELILRKAAGKEYPVSDEVQSGCYQDFCSRLLYELNRRESHLKDFALGFAEASHDLLVKSSSENAYRLRQYSSVYVRVTTGDTRAQFDRLRELIDAGVFVLHGGTPRTKTRDADPIQQFKLTFRKLFGLSNFIGLAERDRFELSGDQLEDWLNHPEKGNAILLRNLGGTADRGEEDQSAVSQAETQPATSPVLRASPRQSRLPFDTTPPILKDVFGNGAHTRGVANWSSSRRLEVKELGASNFKSLQIETALIGLGFEERTFESARRLLLRVKPRHVVLIRYPEPGKSKKILKEVDAVAEKVDTVDYDDFVSHGFAFPHNDVIIDITGLAKPILFGAIRSSLRTRGRLWIAHTMAKHYYPLDRDIKKILAAADQRDHYRLLESLSRVLMGEAGPYSIDSLLTSDADDSRRRVLCTFASAKHHRLLSLLDHREYDRIEIVVPFRTSARSEIARIAAEVAAWNFNSASTREIRSDDLEGVLNFLVELYSQWYVDRGYNFEIGLTGSKLQAVACATVSVEFKVAQCWYVRPSQFDYHRFTKGVGKSRYFEISRTNLPR